MQNNNNFDFSNAEKAPDMMTQQFAGVGTAPTLKDKAKHVNLNKERKKHKKYAIILYQRQNTPRELRTELESALDRLPGELLVSGCTRPRENIVSWILFVIKF